MKLVVVMAYSELELLEECSSSLSLLGAMLLEFDDRLGISPRDLLLQSSS